MSQLDDSKTHDYSSKRSNTIEHNNTPKKKSNYHVIFIRSYKMYNNVDSFSSEESDPKKDKCVSCGCIIF